MSSTEWDTAVANSESMVVAAPAPLESRVRAREAGIPRRLAAGSKSQTPLGDRLRELVAADPNAIASVYMDALAAVKWERGLGEWVPDMPTRMRAADSIANRAEGLPIARTELTGAGGGPLTLAALLADDPRDTIGPDPSSV